MQSGLLPHPTNNTEWNCRKEGKTCKKCKTIIIIELNRNYITREMILHMFQSMQKNHTYTVRKPMVSLWYLGVFSRICQEMWTNLHNAFVWKMCEKFPKFLHKILEILLFYNISHTSHVVKLLLTFRGKIQELSKKHISNLPLISTMVWKKLPKKKMLTLNFGLVLANDKHHCVAIHIRSNKLLFLMV